MDVADDFQKGLLWLQPPYLTYFVNIKWWIFFDFNRISKIFYCIIIFNQPFKLLRLLYLLKESPCHQKKAQCIDRW